MTCTLFGRRTRVRYPSIHQDRSRWRLCHSTSMRRLHVPCCTVQHTLTCHAICRGRCHQVRPCLRFFDGPFILLWVFAFVLCVCVCFDEVEAFKRVVMKLRQCEGRYVIVPWYFRKCFLLLRWVLSKDAIDNLWDSGGGGGDVWAAYSE